MFWGDKNKGPKKYWVVEAGCYSEVKEKRGLQFEASKGRKAVQVEMPKQMFGK